MTGWARPRTAKRSSLGRSISRRDAPVAATKADMIRPGWTRAGSTSTTGRSQAPELDVWQARRPMAFLYKLTGRGRALMRALESLPEEEC
jgi:hypothetical protein